MVKNIRVKEAIGKTGKIIVARILPNTDLLTGIIEVCKKNNVKYASVSNCFGSLKKAGYLYLVPIEGTKMGAGYGEINRAEGPIEFLGGVGVVCQRDNDYDVHFHAVFCDKEGKVFGGHVVLGENPVLTTADMVITEIKNVHMYRKYDEESGLIQFLPEK